MPRSTRLMTAGIARRIIAAVVGCVLVGLCIPDVARADEPKTTAADALKLIPDEALGAIVINHLSGFDAKLGKFVAKLNVPVSGEQLKMAKQALGIEEGLDDRGAAALIVLPPILERKTPFPVLALPVTDYEMFVANFATVELGDGFTHIFVFGQSMWIVQRQDFALIMSPRDFAGDTDEVQQQLRQRLKKMLVDRPAEISQAIAGSKDWILRQDVGLIATTAGVKLGMNVAREGIKQAKEVFTAIARRPLAENEERSA